MLSPARTWLLLAALGAAAIALAVGVTAGVERVRPPPQGSPPHAPVDIPRFDVHQHVLPGTVADALRLSNAHFIEAFANLQGGTAGGALEAQLEAAGKTGGRVVVFAQLALTGCCDADWAAREVERVERARALGARGLAVSASFSEAVGDPEVAPVWEAAGRAGLPVLVHTLDREALARAVLLHPKTTFIGAHFAGSAADPAWLGALLDRAPNLYVDTAARLPELGRNAAAARDLMLRHADRVLFGTDLQYLEAGEAKAVIFGAGMPGGREELLRFFLGTWRFFETRDPDIPSPTPATGDFELTGLGLPRAVLDQIYRRNAERVLGVKVPDPAEAESP